MKSRNPSTPRRSWLMRLKSSKEDPTNKRIDRNGRVSVASTKNDRSRPLSPVKLGSDRKARNKGQVQLRRITPPASPINTDKRRGLSSSFHVEPTRVSAPREQTGVRGLTPYRIGARRLPEHRLVLGSPRRRMKSLSLLLLPADSHRVFCS